MATYPFTIEADGLFPSRRVNESRLVAEVQAVQSLAAKFSSLSVQSGNCVLSFSSALSTSEEALLGGVIQAHNGAPPSSVSINSTVSTTTNSTKYVTINQMSLTPVAGTYRVSFGGSIEVAGKNQEVTVAIFVDGVMIASSVRHLHKATTSLGVVYPVNIVEIITVNGNQLIDVRWAATPSASVTCYERSLTAST